MQAHIMSAIVMDATAFKVSHSVGCDINATALPAARARSVSIGAMDELSGKVQNASTHILSSKMHEHTRTASSQVTGASEEMSRKVQNFHWGDG